MADTSTSPQTVTITVDDHDYVVPAGIQLIDAITNYTDFYMPRFCYHERLEPVGMCRMCMAEVENRGRWANVATCTLKVADGMKVRVHSEAAVQARKMTLELLLVNHPLDCPVCDKGGECMLQDQTVAYGPEVGRSVDSRRKYEKPLPISKNVLLDRERCIQCGCCSRYVDEIAGEKTIELVYRGGQTQISPAFDGEYDSHFSGNTCDICPVGALTSASFRFRSRPWELVRKPVISPWDACGTNLWLDTRENVVRRAMPRENVAVNDLWCSDRERFYAYSYLLDAQRLDVPLVRNAETGQLEPASYEDALAAAVEGLTRALSNGQAVAGIGSTNLGCEEQYAFAKFVRGVLGTNNVMTSKGNQHLDARAAAVPTYAKLEQAKTFLLVGNPLTELPLAWLRIYKAVRKRGAQLLTINNTDLHISQAATLNLACHADAEEVAVGALVNLIVQAKQHNVGWIRNKVQGLSELRDSVAAYTLDRAKSAGIDIERLKALATKLVEAEDLVVYAGNVGQGARAAAWNLALVLGTPGQAHGGYFESSHNANSRGADELGLRPDRLPGGAAVADDAARAKLAEAWGCELPAETGLDIDALLAQAAAGELGALVVQASDVVGDSGNPWQEVRNRWLTPALTDEQAAERRAALDKVGFLVVTELFLSETAKLADVVLPSTAFAERAGTYINFEGRIQSAPAALAPILGVRHDLDIVNALAAGVAERLGKSWTALSTEAARAELAGCVAGWANGLVTPPDGKFSFAV